MPFAKLGFPTEANRMSATLQLIVQAAARGARNAHAAPVARPFDLHAPECGLPSRRRGVPALSWPARLVVRQISAYRTRRVLAALDDRALADIGLTRCDIHRVCVRP